MFVFYANAHWTLGCAKHSQVAIHFDKTPEQNTSTNATMDDCTPMRLWMGDYRQTLDDSNDECDEASQSYQGQVKRADPLVI